MIPAPTLAGRAHAPLRLAAVGIGCCLWLAAAVAIAQRSPFNGAEVVAADSGGHLRILIGGHFHGESTNRSGFPASSLLANIDTINALGAHLFLSTGDLYMDARKDSARYAKAFFSKLKVPFFNAPGNHDLGRGGDAQPLEFDLPGRGDGVAGPRSRVLILDTERDDGAIRGDQLDRLRRLQDAEGLHRLFIV
ncbi:MAG: metallophosphoesterase family protein, partial [Flavobacteriales bacterium]